MESSPNRIIIEDLPMDFKIRKTIITEDFFRDIFNELGNIIIKEIVIKNRESRKGIPYAYAYIEFQTKEMAERVIEELNYTKLEDVPIRIYFSDPETSKIKESDAGKLLIKGLPPEIEVSHLHDLFAIFGEIIMCNIPRYYDPNDGTYHSRCYGFVQFRNPKDAEQAFSDLNGVTINGAEVTIELLESETEETFTKVFIKDLPDSIRTKEDLETFVSPFGEIQSISLPLDEYQNPKGYCFCNMKKHKDAISMVNLLNGKKVDGKKLKCAHYLTEREFNEKLMSEQNYRQECKYRKFYICGLDDDITDEKLRQKFEQFGKIESLDIMRDENGKSKVFGFVLFENKEDAEKCLKESLDLTIKGKQIYVAVPMSKDKRFGMTFQHVVSKIQYQVPGMLF